MHRTGYRWENAAEPAAGLGSGPIVLGVEETALATEIRTGLTTNYVDLFEDVTLPTGGAHFSPPTRGAALAYSRWVRSPAWDRQYLTVDLEGQLLIGSGNTQSRLHAIARLRVVSGTFTSLGRVQGNEAIMVPVVVDPSGFTVVLREARHYGPDRRRSLPDATARGCYRHQDLE